MYNFQEKKLYLLKIWQLIFNRHLPNTNKVSDELPLLTIIVIERVSKNVSCESEKFRAEEKFTVYLLCTFESTSPSLKGFEVFFFFSGLRS